MRRDYLGESDGRLTIEALLVCDIVNQKDAHGATIIRRRYGPESFLSCSQPVEDVNQVLQWLFRSRSPYQRYPRSVT